VFGGQLGLKATLAAVPHDLVVLGDCNPDLVLTGDVEPRFGQVEKVVDGGALRLGGSASIVAAGAARLGLRTVLVAVVGDDALGRAQREALERRDVDTTALVVDPERPTGVTVVLSRGEDRAMLTALGTIDRLSGELVDRALLTAARHVHVAAYFLQPRLREDLPDLLRAARQAGATTSLDTNWDPSGAWDGGLMEVLPLVDVFLPNLAEACAISGEHDADAAAAALARSVGTVAVKLGPAGAIARAGDESARAAALEIEVVDTTGAGDSFDAGFLTGRLRGWPLQDCLRLACACGSLSNRAGGVDAQPTCAEARAAAGL
jgi:sugar/nucleoside kinase (ribokinase family)